MSEKVAIKKSTLEAIGEAVRGKDGSTEPIPVNTLAARITAIPSASGENRLQQYFSRTITEITEEDLRGVTKLEDYFFYNCSALKKIDIPTSVIEISNSSMLRWCPLEETRYNGTLKQWCAIKRNVYDEIKYGNLYINGEIIEELNINEKFSFQPNCFGLDNKIKTIKLGNPNVRYVLYDRAFKNSLNLTRVDIYSYKLDYLDGNTNENHRLRSTFSNCTNLTDIYVTWSEGEVEGAPWGAVNATIHYDTLLTFTIDGKEYSTNFKMTWAEWCNSEYNTDGYYIDENESNRVKNANGLYVKYFYTDDATELSRAYDFDVVMKKNTYFTEA